eukprot:5278628-Amphidinium_carterae.2
MAESITGMCNAVIAQSKGADPYALAEVKKFILENGFITPILQSDGEPAIKLLQEKVIEGLNSPVKSRLPPARVHLDCYASDVRAVWMDGVSINDINTNHPAFLWMVEHCVFLHNRYQIAQDGPYERAWSQQCKSESLHLEKFSIKNMRIKR